MSNKIIKPVSFNKTKEDDIKMLNHIHGRNFSGYIKELILRDIKQSGQITAENKPLRTVRGGVKYIAKN